MMALACAVGGYDPKRFVRQYYRGDAGKGPIWIEQMECLDKQTAEYYNSRGYSYSEATTLDECVFNNYYFPSPYARHEYDLSSG